MISTLVFFLRGIFLTNIITRQGVDTRWNGISHRQCLL